MGSGGGRDGGNAERRDGLPLRRPLRDGVGRGGRHGRRRVRRIGRAQQLQHQAAELARADRLRKIPDQVFDLFPVLKDMRSRMGGDLSGGQQQQLSIGRALVTDPSLLILDEPTEGIQPNIVQQIGRVLQQLVTERGMTIVIVEQYLDFIREFSRQFYIMNRGRIVANGETENLKEEIVKQYLGV